MLRLSHAQRQALQWTEPHLAYQLVLAVFRQADLRQPHRRHATHHAPSRRPTRRPTAREAPPRGWDGRIMGWPGGRRSQFRRLRGARHQRRRGPRKPGRRPRARNSRCGGLVSQQVAYAGAGTARWAWAGWHERRRRRRGRRHLVWPLWRVNSKQSGPHGGRPHRRRRTRGGGGWQGVGPWQEITLFACGTAGGQAAQVGVGAEQRARPTGREGRSSERARAQRRESQHAHRQEA